MYKKLIFTVLLTLALCGWAWAGQVIEPLISSTDFANDLTTAYNTTYTGDSNVISFFVEYNETEVDNDISGHIRAQISRNNSTWTDASFYDYAGGTTLQSGETLTLDSTYYFWFSPDTIFPYVRIIIDGENIDADDIATIDCYIIKKK